MGGRAFIKLYGLVAVVLAFGALGVSGAVLAALIAYSLFKTGGIVHTPLHRPILGAGVAFAFSAVLMIFVVFERIPQRLFGVASYDVGAWLDSFAIVWVALTVIVWLAVLIVPRS